MRFRWLIVVAIALAVLGLWELAARQSVFLTLLISSPSRLFNYCKANATSLVFDFLHTLMIATGGLVLALVLGSAAALTGIRYRSAASTLQGASTVAQSVPLIVFAPFLILLFGVGNASQIALASLMAIFPWIIGAISAMRSAQADFDELLLFYDVPFGSRVREVYLPYSLPVLAGAMRISAALAVLGAVIAEFTGSEIGLGRNIFLGTVRLDPELIMSALVMTSLLGVATHLLLSSMERRASWWR